MTKQEYNKKMLAVMNTYHPCEKKVDALLAIIKEYAECLETEKDNLKLEIAYFASIMEEAGELLMAGAQKPLHQYGKMLER